jgi:ATP-dependent helicase/nuclease subunit A
LFEGEELDDPIWGARREVGVRAAGVAVDAGDGPPEPPVALPAWARQPIGPEPRPPRPLAPSAAGEDRGADPPLLPELARTAARRGVLTHRLLERLPDLPAEARRAAGEAWLVRQGHDLDEAARAELLDRALGVLDHPDFRALFSADALAEVPLAASVDGVVIAGTIDRLLITQEQITVVDFKTARRPPERAEDIPALTLAQMTAYVAALEVIYPGRAIRAAVLYTQTPQLFELAPETLALHKDRLGDMQQSYAPDVVE